MCNARWHQVLNPTLTKGPWEKEEDDMIIAWVEQHGPVKWSTLAAERIPWRTGMKCYERWHQVLNPALTKGPWEKEEDDMIIAWVEQHGPVKWNTLAAERVKGRTGKKCNERWHQVLNPDIKQGKKKRKYEEGAGGSRSEGAKQQKRSQGSRENAMARRAEVVVKRESDMLLSDGLIHLRCTSAAPPLNLSTLTPSSPYELGYVEAKIGEDESADWALFLSKQFKCLRPYGDHWLLKAMIYPEGVASNPHYDHRICLRVIFTYVEHAGGVKRFLYGTSRTDMLSTMVNHDIVGATVVTDSPHGGAMMFSSQARGALHSREIVVDLEDEKETCQVIPKKMPCPTPTTEPPYHAGCAAQNGACGSVVADLMLKDNSYERQAIEAYLESERNRGEFSPPPPPPYLTGVEDFLRRARDEGEEPNCPHASTRIDWIDLN